MRKGPLGSFKKNEWHEVIAQCVLNQMVQVSYKNIDHKRSYDHFMHSGRCTFLSINFYVSERIFVPVTTVHMFQRYKILHMNMKQ